MESLKGKLTEEEFDFIWKKFSGYKEDVFKMFKQKGYIKQNPVEKAEESLKRLHKSAIIGSLVYEEIINGFNYLKKQLEDK
jgi:hypothetical protein